MSNERPQTVEELALWAAEHDGKINAYWEAQHKWNYKKDTADVARDRRVTAIEKKVIVLCTLSAAVGSVIGSIVSGYISAQVLPG